MKKTSGGKKVRFGEQETALYVILMLVVFPQFYTQGMLLLTGDKERFFLRITFIYFCIMLPAVITAFYDMWKTKKYPKSFDILFAVLLLAAIFISTLYAEDSRKTFFEMTSRSISGLCFLVCVLVYFVVREYGVFDKFTIWGWLIGSAIMYLFGILCSCGINFMNIQDGLASSRKGIFLTPLGNTNFNTCYVCLMLMPVLVMYMIRKEQLLYIAYGINIFMGFLFVYFIKTDSAIIAIIAGVILLGYFALEEQKWSEKYLQMLGIYLGAKSMIIILLWLFPQQLYSFYGISSLLLKKWLVIGEIICYVLICVIWKQKGESIRKAVLSVRKYLVYLLIIFAVLCIGCTVYTNIYADSIGQNAFLCHLVLRDNSFSNRGIIWKSTAKLLYDESLGRKLFGNGLHSFRGVLKDLPNTADPHNEVLQMFYDMGILGIVGYYGLIGSTLLKALHNRKEYGGQIVIIVTLIVVFLQSLANAYSIYHLPLFMIFLALANGYMHKKI